MKIEWPRGLRIRVAPSTLPPGSQLAEDPLPGATRLAAVCPYRLIWESLPLSFETEVTLLFV